MFVSTETSTNANSNNNMIGQQMNSYSSSYSQPHPQQYMGNMVYGASSHNYPQMVSLHGQQMNTQYLNMQQAQPNQPGHNQHHMPMMMQGMGVPIHMPVNMMPPVHYMPQQGQQIVPVPGGMVPIQQMQYQGPPPSNTANQPPSPR